MARKLSRKPHLITVAYPSGTVRTLDAETERLARQRIFYVLADNTSMTAAEANRHADSVELHQAYETGGFKFILEPITGTAADPATS